MEGHPFYTTYRRGCELWGRDDNPGNCSEYGECKKENCKHYKKSMQRESQYTIERLEKAGES